MFEHHLSGHILFGILDEQQLHVVLNSFFTLRHDLSFISPECDPLSIVKVTNDKGDLETASLFSTLCELLVKVLLNVVFPNLKESTEEHLIHMMEPYDVHHDKN